jgi:DNA repair exonuclease SbcCD ATPase subunit
MAKLRAEHQAAVAARAEAVAVQTAWCSAQESWKAYQSTLSRLGRYVQDGAWVGGPVSSEVDTTNYDVMLNNELRKQREAAQIEERIKLESVQRAQAEKDLARLVVPPAVTDLDSLSKHAALRSSQARALAKVAQSAADGLRAKQAAARDLETQYKVQMATYQAGQAQLAELTRTVSEMDTNNALIKKLRQARPVLAAKLWAGLLAAISRTFSELRGLPSVVGRSADGFEVDGKPAADLSGSTLDILGLAVRISLMRAFLPGVGLLILDEPAAAMDAAREERLLAALATLDFDQVLMVSHGDTAKAIAGNVVLL